MFLVQCVKIWLIYAIIITFVDGNAEAANYNVKLKIEIKVPDKTQRMKQQTLKKENWQTIGQALVLSHFNMSHDCQMYQLLCRLCHGVSHLLDMASSR